MGKKKADRRPVTQPRGPYPSTSSSQRRAEHAAASTRAKGGAEHAALPEAETDSDLTPATILSDFSLSKAAETYFSELSAHSIHSTPEEQDISCFNQSATLSADAVMSHLKRVQTLQPAPEPPHPEIKRRRRAGRRHNQEKTLAGEDGFLRKRVGLYLRALRKGEVVSNQSFSILQHGSYSTTGWQGTPPPIKDRKAIQASYNSGAIDDTLQKHFYPVYYSLDKPCPAFLLDQFKRTYGYRSTQCNWMECSDFQIYGEIELLLRTHLDNPSLASKMAKEGTRGPHFPCIIGHYRQYTKAPVLTAFHSKNAEAVSKFIESPIMQRISSFVSSLVLTIFPGVAVRFLESAEWHFERHGIRPFFGYFWNLCINGIFPGQKSINTVPHSDAKNVVGVCALVVYLIPGFEFDHQSKSWLVLWEAGLVIELPPWVVFLYPSSLLYHFNVDVKDFKFVLTNGARPTPENSRPIGGPGDEGRGSLVYFNQATMYHGAETGYDTLSEAEEAGYSRTVCADEKADLSFMKHSHV